MSVQTLGFLTRNIPMARKLRARYGDMFTVRALGFPPFVILGDPRLIEQVFKEDPTVLHAGTESPLAAVLGNNSLLAIDEERHLSQRRLLLPPFHGERMKSYAGVVREIAEAEFDTWPVNEEFQSLPSMMRITLRTILRTIYGARGASLQRLEDLIPRTVEIGAKMVFFRFAQRDLGPRSPWGKFLRLRAQCDDEMDKLIAEARQDPDLAERSDVLAMLVQARHEDGSPMTDEEIRDQLLTLMIAGHETTSNTLGWIVERLRRNPEVLAKLTESVRAGDVDYLNATVSETLRIRPTVNFAVRACMQPYELNGYVLPAGTRIACNPALTHDDPRLFDEPRRYRPERFLEQKPSSYVYIPFGGGIRRCIGASFALMEAAEVMKAMLERFDIAPTEAPPEGWTMRGPTFAPSEGAMLKLRPRSG